MVLVRERRHQQALRLSMPSPSPILRSSSFKQQLSPPSPLQIPITELLPESPRVESPSELEKLAVLGHGNGGTVYKVRHRRSSSIYALKVLRFDQDTAGIRQQATREAEILKRVDSPYIVKCHGVFLTGMDTSVDTDTSAGTGTGDMCFMMEYMEAGSLLDVLRVHGRLPENVLSGVGKRVLEGLKYLHEMDIVHRDIKPSNLLINGRGEVKIADFGVSRVVLSVGNHNSPTATAVDVVSVDDDVECVADMACDSCAGTCAYMSPERFDPDKWIVDGGCDGFAGDVWALGVALLECHVGHFPLIGPGQRPDWATLMCAICFGEPPEIPDTASAEFRSFVQRCLERDWRRRGTVTELLNHPFVAADVSQNPTEGLVDASAA